MSEFRESLRVEIGDMEDIPLEDNTEKDYKKWLDARNKKIIENPIWEETKRKMQQRQLQEDLDMEFNERNRGGYGR